MIQSLTAQAEHLRQERHAIHQRLQESRVLIDQFAESAEQIGKFVFSGHLRNIVTVTDRMEYLMGQTQKVVDGLVAYANQQNRTISDLKTQLTTAQGNALDSQDTASLKEGQDFLDSVTETGGAPDQPPSTPPATPVTTPPATPGVDANGNPVIS